MRKAGFLYDFGEDGGGFFTRGMQDPSGFYIDMGASELIIDGRIAVRNGVSVDTIRERSVVLSDGAELPADFIVYATGYRRLAQAGAILSSEIIDKLGPIGGIGSGVRSDHGPWRDKERMEADTAAGPLVSQWQFWADAILLAHPGAADQGPPDGLANASLRAGLIRGAGGRKTSRCVRAFRQRDAVQITERRMANFNYLDRGSCHRSNPILFYNPFIV